MAERPVGWEGGRLNDDGGGDGDGDGDADAMARHHKQVAYKDYNTLHLGDGGIAAQLFTALVGIGNGERKSLPSKPKKRIPTKKKKRLGKKGNSYSSPSLSSQTSSSYW